MDGFMRPSFDLMFQGSSLKERLHPFLISLTLTDEAELKSDKLNLVLANHNLELPRTSESLQLRLGYEETGLIDMGRFTIDGYTVTAQEVRITAHATDFLKTLNKPKTRTFENVSLGTVIQTIAHENAIPTNLQGLSAELIPVLHQTEESNLHFLTRLARTFNLLLKSAGGVLVAMRKPVGYTSVLLTPHEVLNWSYRFTKPNDVSQVSAAWYDSDEAEDHLETVGTPEGSVYTLRGIYPTAQAARTAAQTILQRMNQKPRSSSRLTLWAILF